MSDRMTPNERPLTIVEWLPMPPERGYGREDYIDETWCALCGLRTEGGPCPQGCPSEFD